MAGKFEIKQTTNGKFYFNLKAGNGLIILSSEIYETKDGAISGIEAVRKNALDENSYERKTSKNGDPYFILKAGNGMEIGRSELYNSSKKMEDTIESVKNNSENAEIIGLAK